MAVRQGREKGCTLAASGKRLRNKSGGFGFRSFERYIIRKEHSMTTGGQGPSTYEFDPAALSCKVDAEIRGETAAIAPVVEKIMVAVGQMGCGADHDFEIRLSLSEALANAVEHGCKNDPDKLVQICVECDPDRGILIVVKDPGPGFDPSQIPSPVEGKRIFAEGGRGVFIINQLMDEVHYEQGGTQIRMRKRGACPSKVP